MATPLDQSKPAPPAQPASLSPSDSIARQVIEAIGEPLNFRRVHVRSLWGDHYRVNVLIGSSDAFATVAKSYFLVAKDGKIVTSTPALRREY